MNSALNIHEQRVLAAMRRLPAAAVKEVEDFVIFLEARSLTWNYRDEVSVARAAEVMARDPFLRREIDSMAKEFSNCESDGLEPY